MAPSLAVGLLVHFRLCLQGLVSKLGLRCGCVARFSMFSSSVRIAIDVILGLYMLVLLLGSHIIYMFNNL